MPQTFNVGCRSLFVTLTAWAFIVLSALVSASALVQQAVVRSWMTGGMDGVHWLGGWMLTYLPWVVAAGLLLSVATLATAIGLLLRLEWARRIFIGLLGVAVVANLGGLWLQQAVMLSLADLALHHGDLPAQAVGVFGGFVTAARLMAALVTFGGCGLLLWIGRRLMSPAVRQEFA